jgi:hypothetical protein
MHKAVGKTNTLKDHAKKSKKGRKVDISILGFKGAADPNQIVGELDVLNNNIHYDDEKSA